MSTEIWIIHGIGCATLIYIVAFSIWYYRRNIRNK
jgi:hypothetical protein